MKRYEVIIVLIAALIGVSSAFACIPAPVGVSVTGRIDPQTHIHYFNARHYSGTIGNDLGTPRFLTPDPIFGDLADPLSWNRYAYCRGNPVNRVDPNGLDSFVFYHAQHFEKQAESQIPV